MLLTGVVARRVGAGALKWLALLGVVFALGAGSTTAQVTIELPDDAENRVKEGESVAFKVITRVRTSTNQRASSVEMEFGMAAGRASGSVSAAEDADEGAFEPYRLLLTFQGLPDGPEEHYSEETVIWTPAGDDDAEDEAALLRLRVTAAGGHVGHDGNAIANPPDVAITIEDDEEQTFEWVSDSDPPETPTAPEGGGSVTFTLEADPAPVDLTYPTRFSLDAEGYTLGRTEYTFRSNATRAAIAVTPPVSDGNRVDDTVTLRAIKAGTDEDLDDSLSIEVPDIHALPDADAITAQAYTVDADGDKTDEEAASVTEGDDPVVVTVTVDRGTDGHPAGETLSVAVEGGSGQALDYRVDPAKLTIASGDDKRSADFKLWALADDDVGDEDLVLRLVAMGDTPANGPGEVEVTFSLPIEDATTPLVLVKDGANDAVEAALGADPLNAGRTIEIGTGDLFVWDDDAVAVAFSVDVDGAAVSAFAGDDAVTLVTEGAGEAQVTVTATATPRGGSLTVTQDRANVARLTFPVTVELAALAITLTGPDDVNLVEGMSYAVTAEANRAVTEDTVVELTPTAGTASPADYEVEPITIAAGEVSGSTMLLVVEDGEADSGAGSPETLTLTGRVGSMTTNALTFHLWDAAVPALPVVAQLLLAALLGLGGYRRYRRR